MRLLLGYTIRNEWQVRCIAEVVPGLAGYAGQSHIDIDAATARDVIQDCRFQADSQAMDHLSHVRQSSRPRAADPVDPHPRQRGPGHPGMRH